MLTKTKKAMKKKSQVEKEKERKQRLDFREQRNAFQKDNQRLTAEYKQFTRWFKDTQQKYESFEKSDEKRIKEIWAMHDQEARDLVQKIMHADRVIHVQQL